MIDTVTTFERLSARADRIQNIKSPKRRYNAILKLQTEWRDVSRDFLFGRTSMEEIQGCYTNLDNISAHDMDTYFADFVDTLGAHTDRMFFNAWMRCQVCLMNAIEHGAQEFEQKDNANDGSN